MQAEDMEFLAPGISFSLKDGQIRIFRSTISALGEPKYIRFLLDLQNKSLGVQGRSQKTGECFAVPGYTQERWVFRIMCTNLLKNIWEITGWNLESTYRARGIYKKEYDMILFELTSAKKWEIQVEE